VSVWSEQPPRINRVGEFALWGGAGVLVLAAHLGAVLIMMRQPPVEAGDSAPPPAIMIEMAAEPEAVKTEENLVTPDETAAEEVKTEMTEPVEEPVPEEVPVPPEPVVEPAPVEPPPPEPVQPIVEEPPPEVPPVQEVVQPTLEPPPEPVQEVVEPLPEPPPPEPPPEIVEPIDPIEQQMTAALENVEVPLPVTRPLPPPTPEQKKPEPKTAPKKPVVQKPREQPKQARASKAAEQAQAQVRQADRNAARQSATGLFSSSVSPARWQARLQSHLQRRKRYPSDAQAQRVEGTAYVRFSIDNNGNVLSSSLTRSSGSASLDQEAVAAVRRSSPVPAPPADAGKTITVPFSFTLR